MISHQIIIEKPKVYVYTQSPSPPPVVQVQRLPNLTIGRKVENQLQLLAYINKLGFLEGEVIALGPESNEPCAQRALQIVIGIEKFYPRVTWNDKDNSPKCFHLVNVHPYSESTIWARWDNGVGLRKLTKEEHKLHVEDNYDFILNTYKRYTETYGQRTSFARAEIIESD